MGSNFITFRSVPERLTLNVSLSLSLPLLSHSFSVYYFSFSFPILSFSLVYSHTPFLFFAYFTSLFLSRLRKKKVLEFFSHPLSYHFSPPRCFFFKLFFTLSPLTLIIHICFPFLSYSCFYFSIFPHFTN